MDKYVKRIQSRLKHHGISLSKDVCREAYKKYVSEDHWENPHPTEVALVVEKLEEYSNLMANIDEPAPLAIQETETIEITEAENPDVWEKLQAPAEENAENAIALSEQEPEAAPLVPAQPGSLAAGETGGGQLDPTQPLSQAIYQLGVANNNEAKQMLSALFTELSADIADTEEMVAALVAGYLNKRQSVLSSAITTLHSARSAQSESFQAGLSEDFFDRKRQDKHQFLSSVREMFA